MSSIVPITIRKHLVPYFFKESEGKVFTYGNQKVKAALFSPDVSSVGKIIRMLMTKSGSQLKINNWNTVLCTNMAGMFSNSVAFNQNIGSWNVSNVVNFTGFMASKTPATFSSTNLDAIYNR